ncbi:MAG: hypothetical protein AB7K24_20525 [Gemmataceae bacterium]
MRASITFTMIGLLVGVGCGAEHETKAQPNPAIQAVRGKGRARNQNDLRQLALYYFQYEIEQGRPPAEWKQLKEYMGRDGRSIARLVDDGTFIIVYKVKPRSDNVVAYEKEPSQGDRLLVAMGDGSIQILSPPQLQAKLEQQANMR